VGAGEEPDPARGGESAHPYSAGIARTQGEPMGGEDCRDVTPTRAGTDPYAGVLAHLDPAQVGEVDHDAAVVRRAAGEPVPARSHRERHVLPGGAPDRALDLGGGGWEQHETGIARSDEHTYALQSRL